MADVGPIGRSFQQAGNASAPLAILAVIAAKGRIVGETSPRLVAQFEQEAAPVRREQGFLETFARPLGAIRRVGRTGQVFQ